MPVLTINGDKKKVACGPCIRGHRSSKCAHKDRVLIEVRKPGRPLGTCPHPAGSCSCERVVVNYMIPKERSSPVAPQSMSAASPPASRIQKKSQRSITNLSQSTVQKVISGDPAALAALANFPANKPAAPPSDSSSQPPSAASSTSSTPKIDALQGTPLSTYSRDHPQFPRTSGGWQEAWDDLYTRPQSSKSEGISISSALKSNTPPCCCSGSADTAGNQILQQPQIANAGNPFQQSSQAGSAIYQAPLEQFALRHYAFPHPDFPSFELSIGCGGMQTPTDTIQERLMAGTHNKCDCGDNCNCFACMTHPNNRATLDYVKYHNELLSRPSSGEENLSNGPFSPEQRQAYSLQYPFNTQGNLHPVPQSFQPQFAAQFGGRMPMEYTSMDWTNQTTSGASIPHTPVTELEQLHFQTTQPIAPHSIASSVSFNMFNEQEQFSQVAPRVPPGQQLDQPPRQIQEKVAIQSPPLVAAPFDADSPLDDDTSTLSPSSFLFQQFTIPGCDDVTGTCQCGDGCECAGCLTHSGHRQDEQASCCAPMSESEDNLHEFVLDSVKLHL